MNLTIKEKVLVVGLGEVGRALFEVLKDSGNFEVYGFDIRKEITDQIDQGVPPKKVDIMHICIPCMNMEIFTKNVETLAQQFQPDLIIIDSTVIPGSTTEVAKCSMRPTAHSPIRGVHLTHQHMVWEIRRWTKYVGGASDPAGERASEHFKKAGLKTKILKSCKETELAKLFETTYRAWLITCFQEMHRISRSLGANFDDTVDFLEDTHRVRLDRPIMFPGVIGGHCQIPNTEMLLKIYDSNLLREILKSNERRKEEMKDKSTRDEVEKIKVRSFKLEKDLTCKENVTLR